MTREEELAVKVTKEIVVKFIEVGRLSANSFEEVWGQIYHTVKSSLGESSGDIHED
jgi:hypothetical protein